MRIRFFGSGYGSGVSSLWKKIIYQFKFIYQVLFFGIFIFFVSDVPSMPQIQKTNSDPLKFGPDPGLYGLQRMSDTRNMKIKKKACKIIQNLHTIVFLISPIIQSPGSEILLLPDTHPYILNHVTVRNVTFQQQIQSFSKCDVEKYLFLKKSDGIPIMFTKTNLFEK